MGIRLFLTGLNGYLGGMLARDLAESEEIESITGIDLRVPTVPLPNKLSFRQMDIRSPALAEVLVGHDVVVNTALMVYWGSRVSAAARDDINLNGTRNLAEAAVNAGVKRFIHTSSVAAYNPRNVNGHVGIGEDSPLGDGSAHLYYWDTKAQTERIVSAVLEPAGVALTILRPSYIIGPTNRSTIPNLRRNAVRIYGHDPKMQFIHESDVAAAFGQAVTQDLPGAFNVVPDDALAMSQIFEILGIRPVVTIPLWLGHLFCWVRWRYFGSDIHPSWLQASLIDFTATNTKLKQHGWHCRFSSEAALKSAL